MLSFCVAVGKSIPPTFPSLVQVYQIQKATQLDEWIKFVRCKLTDGDNMLDIDCALKFLREANCMLDVMRDVGWRHATHALLNVATECYREGGELFNDVFEIFGCELDFRSCQNDPSTFDFHPPKVARLLDVLHRIGSHKDARVVIIVKSKFVSDILLGILRKIAAFDSWTFVQYFGKKHQTGMASTERTLSEFNSGTGHKAIITLSCATLQDVGEAVNTVVYFGSVLQPGRELIGFQKSRIMHIMSE